jgi:hypothetical protein
MSRKPKGAPQEPAAPAAASLPAQPSAAGLAALVLMDQIRGILGPALRYAPDIPTQRALAINAAIAVFEVYCALERNLAEMALDVEHFPERAIDPHVQALVCALTLASRTDALAPRDEKLRAYIQRQLQTLRPDVAARLAELERLAEIRMADLHGAAPQGTA